MSERTPEQLAEMEARLREWVPEDFPWRMAIKRERGKWFALGVDFDITGHGDTIEAAVEELGELVGHYLGSYFRAGEPFEAAVRPIPRRMQMRIHLSTIAVKPLLRLSHGAERLPFPRERSYPSSDLPVEAAALC
jgi:predicted RNase H-like HicB family nuclease